MPIKLMFTIVGFNGLALVFLAGVIVVYFRPALFGMMTSLFLGWLTAFVNLNSSEPQFPVLLLLSFGFFIGYLTRQHVWKYALTMGVFVPISQFAWLAATHQTGLLLPDGAGSLIAFVPSFGGAYFGKFVAQSQKTLPGKIETGDGVSV